MMAKRLSLILAFVLGITTAHASAKRDPQTRPCIAEVTWDFVCVALTTRLSLDVTL